MDQIKHVIAVGALKPGEQLPGLRTLAETLVVNPNTVAKVYRELEHEGIIELRQGTGAFVTARRRDGNEYVKRAQPLLRETVSKLFALGLGEPEIRRLLDAELNEARQQKFVRRTK